MSELTIDEIDIEIRSILMKSHWGKCSDSQRRLKALLGERTRLMNRITQGEHWPNVTLQMSIIIVEFTVRSVVRTENSPGRACWTKH
jgi:hypothetical protein